jgi:tetratricopeptide (TPR) repeat protein
LAPLSPALGIIDKSIDCTKNIFSANVEKTLKGYQEILQRIAEPDHCGLDDTIHKYIDLGHRYALGLVEATFGAASSLKWADEIESEPLHQVNAWLIRMVYYLRQGNIQQVEQCKKKMEMLQIQNSPSQFYEGSHLYPELMAYATVDDLVRIKQTQEGVEAMARRFEQWVPIVHFAHGEYHRIRGDYHSALSEHQESLRLMEPGKHVTWPHSVGALLKTLIALDRIEEAKEVGEKSLREAREKVGEVETLVIRIPYSVILAKLGEFESAIQQFILTDEKGRQLKMTGINPGMAYEFRAEVAILMKDEAGFRTYAKSCAEQLQKSHYSVLAARYEKLLQKARDAGLVVSEDLVYADGTFEDESDSNVQTIVSEMLTQCHNPIKRAQRTLELIVEQSKSAGGFLYSVQESGLTLRAQSDENPPPDEMDKMVHDYLMAEVEGYNDVTMTCADLGAPTKNVVNWESHLDKNYFPVLLGHNTEEGYIITGVAILYTDQETFYNVPFETVDALSKFLYRAGDVTGVLTDA